MAKQIMVVDDEAGVLTMIGTILKRGGFAVLEAKTASAALELLEETTPDLFIIDVMMPGMDGIILCGEIRARPQTAETPIIILTARSDTETLRQGYQVGIDQYLTKPIVPQDLINIINRILGLRESPAS